MHQNGNELLRSKFICLQNLINLLDWICYADDRCKGKVEVCVEKYFRDLFQTKPGARVSSAMRTEGLDRTTKDSIILIACFTHKNMRMAAFSFALLRKYWLYGSSLTFNS